MEKPKRIQLRRIKGWRKPPGAVVVSRPSKWGNPFRRMGDNEYLYADASHRRKIFTPWIVFDHDQDIARHPVTDVMVIDHYRRWLKGEFADKPAVRPCTITQADIESLRGKDLACWCGLCAKHRDGRPWNEPCPDCKPCHVDVLIEIANKPKGTTDEHG